MTHHALHVLDVYVQGVALGTVSFPFEKEDMAEVAERFLREFPAADHPYLVEHIGYHIDTGVLGEGDFEFGLDLLLDSLKGASRLACHRRVITEPSTWTRDQIDPAEPWSYVDPSSLQAVPTEFWSFVAVATLIVIVPGADMALVARNTLAGGRAAGLRTATGTLLGLGIHAGAALVGLSVVIAASATAFNLVRLVGAAYLVWLGLQTLWASRNRVRAVPIDEPSPRSLPRVGDAPLVQGTLTNVLNPKLAVFFLSFLPQFVDPSRPATPQILVLASTFIAMGAIWLGTYVVAVDRLSGVLTRPAVKRWLDRFIGTTLVALGIRLAIAETD
jgi:threonine/homoserine/homoserine lactone efflux protein